MAASRSSRPRTVAGLALAVLALGACHVVLRFEGRDASGACASDGDCPLGSLHCDPASGSCLACVSDSNCGATAGRPRCNTTLHVCVPCATDQDCGAGARCNASASACVQTCAASGDCASGSSCEDGLCAQCDEDQQCGGTTPYCDPATYRCTACVTDAQCTNPSAPRCNRSQGQCVECFTGTDCPNGMVCDPANDTCTSTRR